MFTVSQRTPEIGIRVALGASPRQVVRGVASHSLRWCAAGLAAGIGGSLLLAPLMSGMLYEIRGIDAPSLAAGCVMLTVISVASSYLPARRAAPRESGRRIACRVGMASPGRGGCR